MTERAQEDLQTSEEDSGRLRTNSETSRSWQSNISQLVTTMWSGSSSRNSSQSEQQDLEEYDCELACPICQEIMKEAYVTQCGHSYCHECISVHIAQRPFCPICRAKLVLGQIYPNFQLNRLTHQRYQQILADQERTKDPLKELGKLKRCHPKSIAATLAEAFSQSDLKSILDMAVEERNVKDVDQEMLKRNLVRLFLEKLKVTNEYKVQTLLEENALVVRDLKHMNEALVADDADSRSLSRKRKYEDLEDDDDNAEAASVTACTTSPLPKAIKVDNDSNKNDANDDSLLDIDPWFDDLKDLYYSSSKTDPGGLGELPSTLVKVTQNRELKVVDTLYYTERTNQGSSIVSSIEFDRDQEFFAAGGVTKEIKIYDLSMILDADRRSDEENLILHCPVKRLTCGHKISCLSWSSYIKSQLASSDYEGVIDVWDVMTGQKVRRFHEHSRRAWSVDISTINPQLIASGSDDNTAKIWSTSSSVSNAIHTLELKGNVCCAKFAPHDANLLAVGCADHNVSCFDLRYLSEPIKVFEGHSKAVSYVKWLNNKQLVSASTDSTIKMWDFDTKDCLRTFKGHQNEKNFVGLSVNDDWISCGSETNTVYTYHKNASAPVVQYKFPAANEQDDSSSALFVSSVCWMPNTNKIIASNSRGIIKVFQMK